MVLVAQEAELAIQCDANAQEQLRSDIYKELRIKEGAENMRRAVQDPNRRSAHDRRALAQLHTQIKSVNTRLQDLQQELADLDAQMLMASQIEFEDEQGTSVATSAATTGAPTASAARVLLRPQPPTHTANADERSATSGSRGVSFGNTNGAHSRID